MLFGIFDASRGRVLTLLFSVEIDNNLMPQRRYHISLMIVTVPLNYEIHRRILLGTKI